MASYIHAWPRTQLRQRPRQRLQSSQCRHRLGTGSCTWRRAKGLRRTGQFSRRVLRLQAGAMQAASHASSKCVYACDGCGWWLCRGVGGGDGVKRHVRLRAWQCVRKRRISQRQACGSPARCTPRSCDRACTPGTRCAWSCRLRTRCRAAVACGGARVLPVQAAAVGPRVAPCRHRRTGSWSVVPTSWVYLHSLADTLRCTRRPEQRYPHTGRSQFATDSVGAFALRTFNNAM